VSSSNRILFSKSTEEIAAPSMTATIDAVVCAVAGSDCVKYRGNKINKKLRYDLKDTILKPKKSEFCGNFLQL
jgi:hypothetical protein